MPDLQLLLRTAELLDASAIAALAFGPRLAALAAPLVLAPAAAAEPAVTILHIEHKFKSIYKPFSTGLLTQLTLARDACVVGQGPKYMIQQLMMQLE